MNIVKSAIRRGEIYYYDFGENKGSIQNGYRPVLVLQDTKMNQVAPTVIVADITSANKKRYLYSHVDLGQAFGLSEPSMVLLEQIRSVNKSDLKKYIGFIDEPSVWKQIEIGIRKTFGMWKHRDETKYTRCLCRECLKDYIHSNAYAIRRADLFANIKDRCEKCDGWGYDYIIHKKK